MDELDTILKDLVIANRVLDHEHVVDADGHISVRHPHKPARFFISRSLAPALVHKEDIVELGLDGEPINDEQRALYLERFIHAAIYEFRPEVMAIVRACSEDLLPFSIASGLPLRAAIQVGGLMGAHVPVWDIAEQFGETNLLVNNMDRARDLANIMGSSPLVLMRGCGFVATGRSLMEVVRMAVYQPRNARALLRSNQFGGAITYLRPGEVAARRRDFSPVSSQTWRAWEYWAKKAGCSHLLTQVGESRAPAKTS